MPPKKGIARKRAASPAEEYDNDGGFVVDEEHDASRSAKRSRTAQGSAGNDVKKREGKAEVTTGMQKDESGCEFWEISKTRRVQISEFRGKTLISIREYYEKDGKMLPGKKGISLSIDQFTAILDVLPEMLRVLKDKGEDIPTPQHGKDEHVTTPQPEDERHPDVAESPPPPFSEQPPSESNKPTGGKSKLDKFKFSAPKQSFEATSDEEE
ncbi:hypothetical protein B0A49_03280 [Cryomyces minteri]|uniref:Transcriptional coactivator p15 (PC4) C-terminal domain-containing protein n=1 Tax=Cryomyces minteri TaxID=331657 RepID=A0A4U0XLE8_9PEZI|nr:hypothetical protein B0A49_03280 [Cryomyces minteri]